MLWLNESFSDLSWRDIYFRFIYVFINVDYDFKLKGSLTEIGCDRRRISLAPCSRKYARIRRLGACLLEPLKKVFLWLYGGKIKIDTQQGLVCATYNSPEEFAQRALSQRLVPQTVYTNRFEEQGAGTCPKNPTHQKKVFLRLYGGKIKIDTQQGLVCATYNSPEEFAQRALSQRLVPQTVYTNRFEEQVAGTCPKNSTQFQFVRMVAETKVWSLRLIDCKAGTMAKGQNLLANISTSGASLLKGQYLIQEK